MRRRLLYVRTILEEGGFSRAAQKLYISQPSLSQYIRGLETEIGSELFARHSKPLRLTQAGEIFLETEEKIDSLEKDRQRQIDDLSELKRGRIAIGSSHYRSSYFLTAVLPIFKRRYPGIEITLEEGTTSELEMFALKGTTDFSIVLLPLTLPDLAYEELFQEEILLALPRDHRFLSGMAPETNPPPPPMMDFKQLKEEPFIIMTEGQKLRRSFFELCERAEFSPKIVLETQSMATAAALAAVGVGVTLVADALARGRGLPAAPVYLRLKEPLPPRRVVVAYSREKYLSKAARAFIEVMKHSCRSVNKDAESSDVDKSFADSSLSS